MNILYPINFNLDKMDPEIKHKLMNSTLFGNYFDLNMKVNKESLHPIIPPIHTGKKKRV